MSLAAEGAPPTTTLPLFFELEGAPEIRTVIDDPDLGSGEEGPEIVRVEEGYRCSRQEKMVNR